MRKWIKIFFIAVIVLISFGCSNSYKISRDEKNRVVIENHITWDNWQKEAEWSEYKAESYEVDKFLLGMIKPIVETENLDFLLFAGSWCSDSKDLVPRLYKIFSEANIDKNKIELIGVNRLKREETGIAETYKIEKVPTLVISKNGKEKGRIVETVKKTLEEDILTIIGSD